jgi:selenocysteine lyase/cysteine desulfurase
MLQCQRHLFDLPREVSYLATASSGLLPKATLDLATTMANRKGRPWLLSSMFPSEMTERTRTAAARLINASPDDVAHMPSVGLAIAQVGRIVKLARGSRVLVMTDDHASPIFEWQMRAGDGGFTVEMVGRPADGNWTAAILAAIERPGSAPLSLMSISTLHWTEGCAIDVARITTAAKKQGALVLWDATQSVGVIPFDVATLDPDFVTFPTYKWLLGPNGRSFLYVAKRHQNGIPLDQMMQGRRDVRAEADVYYADTRYVETARRFDIGQRDYYVSMETAAIGMELVASLGIAAIGARLAHLTSLLADGLASIPGISLTPAAHRTPHILCAKLNGGVPAGLIRHLADSQVFVSQRIGAVRIAPHIYNDETDIARCVAAMRAFKP